MPGGTSDEILTLRRQFVREQQRGNGLHRVLQAVGDGLSGVALLQDIVAGAVDVLDGAAGAVWLVEERNGAAVVVRTAECGSAEIGDGIATDVLQMAAALLGDGLVLAAPLWWEQRIGGVIAVIAASARFDNDDLDTLTLFAEHAAVAIANARLLEVERRRAVRSAIINRISQQIAESLSLDLIFQMAVESISQQLDLAHVAAGIVDPEDPELLALLAHAGTYELNVPPGYRQHISVGLVGAATSARQRLLVHHPLDDPRFFPALAAAPLQTALVLPLVVGERLLGVLNIESIRPIDVDEANDLEQIAHQLAVAMDRAALFARIERALGDTQLLYETSQRMSTALTEDAVISTYLEYVARSRRYPCGVMLYEFDEWGQRCARNLWGYWSPSEGLVHKEQRMPYIPDDTVPLLDAGQMIMLADAVDDPRVFIGFRQYMAQSHWRALAVIPLMVHGERIGIVWLTHQSVYQWNAADLQPYQITATLLATAIDHRRQLVRFAAQSQQIAVLEERRRLARELHDSVTQSLFSMSLLSQAIPDLWEIDQPASRMHLGQIRDLTRSALGEMRALLFALRPAALAKKDLAQALQEYGAAFSERTGMPVTITASGALTLPDDVEHALFRIAQEALTNAARYAQAQSVQIILRCSMPLQLDIIDDGRGFQLGHVGEGHFGLVSMRERAASINASITIHSAPGQGTKIALVWPQI